MAIKIEGKLIQHDASGQGHAWLDATYFNLLSHIQEEIAAAIIDGKLEEGAVYTASNGQHYRWVRTK